MNYLKQLLFVFFALFSLVGEVWAGGAKTVWVNSYTRKDGTYVSGHWRSPPDGTSYTPSSTLHLWGYSSYPYYSDSAYSSYVYHTAPSPISQSEADRYRILIQQEYQRILADREQFPLTDAYYREQEALRQEELARKEVLAQEKEEARQKKKADRAFRKRMKEAKKRAKRVD